MCAIISILYYILSSLWLPYSNKAYCIVFSWAECGRLSDRQTWLFQTASRICALFLRRHSHALRRVNVSRGCRSSSYTGLAWQGAQKTTGVVRNMADHLCATGTRRPSPFPCSHAEYSHRPKSTPAHSDAIGPSPWLGDTVSTTTFHHWSPPRCHSAPDDAFSLPCISQRWRSRTTTWCQ